MLTIPPPGEPPPLLSPYYYCIYIYTPCRVYPFLYYNPYQPTLIILSSIPLLSPTTTTPPPPPPHHIHHHHFLHLLLLLLILFLLLPPPPHHHPPAAAAAVAVGKGITVTAPREPPPSHLPWASEPPALLPPLPSRHRLQVGSLSTNHP